MKVGDIFTKQKILVEIVLPLLLDLQLTVKSIILILLIHIIIINEGPQQLENKKMHDVRLHDVIEHSMRIVCICAIKAD